VKILRQGRVIAVRVRPHQWANDWISDGEGGIHNPMSVQLDPQDVARFDATLSSPDVGHFWRTYRLDRVTLRFRSIPPVHDDMVERVALLLDAAAGHTMDGLPASGADQYRVMVAMWFNRLAWHLRTGHVMPALVHELLMAGAVPSTPWWHGSDGVISKVRLEADNREGTRE
jgi:hypothetical protein